MKRVSKFLGVSLAFFVSTVNLALGQRQYDVSNFTGISIAIPADVNVFQSKEYKLEIKASEKYLNDIRAEVEGDVLKIRFKSNSTKHIKSDRIEVNIWSPFYNLISVVGSCDVNARTPIVTSELKLKINGSGDIKILELESDKVVISSNGSGDIKLKGNKLSESLKVNISGSGDVEASGFACKKVSVSISGSGDVEVNATEKASGSVSGSGDIVVHGTALVDFKVSGSGSVRHVK